MPYDFKSRYTRFKDDGQSADKMFKDFEYGWRNRGVLPDGQKFEMQDAVDYTSASKPGNREFFDAVNTVDAPMWIPRVINNIIREAREPILVGEKLLQRLDYTPGQLINLGATGAISGDFDMPEIGEYPEVTVSWGEGTQIRNVGKSGCSLKFSSEIIRYSHFPVVEFHTRQVARALARFKEEKIFSVITNQGQVLFDNENPAADNAIYGATTGRGLTGSANGSMRMEDLMKMMIHIIHSGFMPDTLLMNTLTWIMWLQDPHFKEFALMSGGGVFYGSYSGNAVEANDWPNMGGQGISKGRAFDPATTAAETYARTTAKANPPSYFNFGPPLKIVVTPFLPYDLETNRTDIILFDSNELGYLIVDHDLQVTDWTDPHNDLYTVKLLERYALAIANEGQAVAVAKNVQVDPGNQVILPAQAFIDVDGDIKELDPTVSPYASTS